MHLAATVESDKHRDRSSQSRLMWPAAIQVGLLTRLISWSPLDYEPLLWD